MQKGHELPAGQTVMFSTGCYSDYSVMAVAKLLKPMNEDAWTAMCDASCEPNNWKPDGYFDSSKAMAWLRAERFIEEIEYVELHLGDYGDRPKWEEA